MRSYAGSAPSRLTGRVTSANHLSLSLERTCCVLIDFLSSTLSFGFTFLSVSSKVALSTQTPPCLEQSSPLWENRLIWSLEEEFTARLSGNGRIYRRTEARDRRFSLLRVRARYVTTENDATRQNWNASVIRSACLRCFASYLRLFANMNGTQILDIFFLVIMRLNDLKHLWDSLTSSL